MSDDITHKEILDALNALHARMNMWFDRIEALFNDRIDTKQTTKDHLEKKTIDSQ